MADKKAPKAKTKPGMPKEQMEAEGARLTEFWLKYKAEETAKRGYEMTQGIFVEQLGDEMSSGNFNHLLRGRQPIPQETLFELAILLNFDPREVRPSIQSFIDKVFKSVRGYELSILGSVVTDLSDPNKEKVIDFARYLAERKDA